MNIIDWYRNIYIYVYVYIIYYKNEGIKLPTELYYFAKSTNLFATANILGCYQLNIHFTVRCYLNVKYADTKGIYFL